jgi:hypothetical protein
VPKIRWSVAPIDASPQQKLNFRNVQIDAVGIGLVNAAAPFLPVFLTRLGATNLQIGLLTAMPAVTGFLLAIWIGRFLQTRRNIIPWFSAARITYISGYTLTGLLPFILPEEYLITGVLVVWAIITIPQTALMVSFSVVMNSVAGPTHRYELMSRRWSILGIVTAITALVVGQFLDQVVFPLNYQIVFLGLSVGGLISYYFSSHIRLPDSEMPASAPGHSFRSRLRSYRDLVFGERAFVQFSIQRFVYMFGIMLAIPLFPLYYVRVVEASNYWIGVINTAQAAVLVIGYFWWTRESRLRGGRFVLLWTTFGLALYPALTAATQQVQLIAIYAGLAGIFQAGLDLVFFDELMKTVPVEYSATFISIAQSLQHFSAIFAPLLGTWMAGVVGLSAALLFSAGVRFAGFALFLVWKRRDAVFAGAH